VLARALTRKPEPIDWDEAAAAAAAEPAGEGAIEEDGSALTAH